jgi:hypothetical protein
MPRSQEKALASKVALVDDAQRISICMCVGLLTIMFEPRLITA